MANQGDNRGNKQPTKGTQLQDVEHSHAGSMGTSAGSMDNQRDTERANQGGTNQANQANKNQPKDAQDKGGQQSHSGTSSGGSAGNR